MNNSHDKKHSLSDSDCHPDAPAHPAGAGSLRTPGVIGSEHFVEIDHRDPTIHNGALTFTKRSGGSSTHFANAPAARYMVFGRKPEGLKRRATKELRPHTNSKSRLELLTEGASRLAKVQFGHALKLHFEKFDAEWWEPRTWTSTTWQPDSEPEHVLALKERKSPFDAVLRIFDTLDKWSFDCAQLVQVVLLYAVVNRLDKESFDNRVASHAPTGGQMLLRVHDSTGLTLEGGSEHGKEELKNLLKISRQRAAAVMGEQEKKFKAAPKGSEITSTNLDPLVSDRAAYGHENTIKMGDDQFIAHGINGSGFATREDIYDLLAKDALKKQKRTLGGPDLHDYKKSNLYVSHVILYGDD